MTEPPAAEPRRSFDGAAEIYHGIRPNYPPSMFADPVHLNPPGATVYSEYLAALFRDNIVAGGRAL